MRRGLLIAGFAVVALPGCSIGSDDGSPGDDGSDKRAAAVECIEGEGLDTSLEGDNALAVGDAEQAPRIVFYLTAGEAEAAQFRGEGEGSEQIGSALLYVRGGGEDELEKIERCLNDL